MQHNPFTNQVFEKCFDLFGFILESVSHSLPHFERCADDTASHDGPDILDQNPSVYLIHQDLSIKQDGF